MAAILIMLIGLYILRGLEGPPRRKPPRLVTPDEQRALLRAMPAAERQQLLEEQRIRLLSRYFGADRQVGASLIVSDERVLDALAGLWDPYDDVERAKSERARLYQVELQRKQEEARAQQAHAREQEAQERQRAEEARARHLKEQEEHDRELIARKRAIAAEAAQAYKDGLARNYGGDIAEDAIRYFTRDEIERYHRGGILRDMVFLQRRQS